MQQRHRSTFQAQTPQPAMFPKQQFVKLRKYILDYLKRNSEINGYCNIAHNSLESTVAYARSAEFHPFSGMSPYHRDQATCYFWETLLKAKQVLVIMAPVSLDGREEKHYYLPGTKPFHTQTEDLFAQVRRLNNHEQA